MSMQIEAHIAILLTCVTNLVGIVVGLYQIRRLRIRLNGHDHHGQEEVDQ